MNRATITIIMHVETDADERALERAVDALITEAAIRDQFLEGETLTLDETTIGIDNFRDVDPTPACTCGECSPGNYTCTRKD